MRLRLKALVVGSVISDLDGKAQISFCQLSKLARVCVPFALVVWHAAGVCGRSWMVMVGVLILSTVSGVYVSVVGEISFVLREVFDR